uniref:Uncharacterized protein n=1 Tax=Manihot esculenta TaxID=3983 RepID=A0A2C9U2R7_MANES
MLGLCMPIMVMVAKAIVHFFWKRHDLRISLCFLSPEMNRL